MTESVYIGTNMRYYFIRGVCDAFDQIEACGGFSQNNVTQYTDYLVIGYYRRNSIHGEKSNKTRLAEKYIRQGKKIAIIREDEFLGMLWQTS
jgi:hypothetical protein